MNTVNEIDFNPLKKFASYFNMLIIAKRIWMILVRVIFLGLVLIAAAYLIAIIIALKQPITSEEINGQNITTVSASISCPGAHPICNLNISGGIMLAVFLGVIAPYILLASMIFPWTMFADRNNFRKEHLPEVRRRIVDVPSFKGRAITNLLDPIVGQVGNVKFSFFMRAYNEGGVLRWRERKMDSIIRFELPAHLPHIIINARENEKARRSNMTSVMDKAVKFQFEGADSLHYDAYTTKGKELEAFHIFTPDVLATLYDTLPMADLEISDNYVWVVQRYVTVNDKTARQLFTGAFALHTQLVTQIKYSSSMSQGSGGV